MDSKRKHKITKVTILHYFRLIFRSILFLLGVFWYIDARITGKSVLLNSMSEAPVLVLIWFFFMFEMLLRFSPSDYESPGCQKQFRKNYIPTGRTDVKLHDNNAVVMVALVWVVINGIIGGLRMTHVFDEGILLLISLLFSICDMICILFFCPFQTWFLKNRCCSSCRIYNWDYLMMFTPLFFIPRVYTWTLLGASLLLLIKWEITVWRYPERFSENTNQYLACKNCTEKLCTHKKHLIVLRKHLVTFAEKQTERILNLTVKKK